MKLQEESKEKMVHYDKKAQPRYLYERHVRAAVPPKPKGDVR
jgi:hypothetical protein